jgi:hypothetical protein
VLDVLLWVEDLTLFLDLGLPVVQEFHHVLRVGRFDHSHFFFWHRHMCLLLLISYFDRRNDSVTIMPISLMSDFLFELFVFLIFLGFTCLTVFERIIAFVAVAMLLFVWMASLLDWLVLRLKLYDGVVEDSFLNISFAH